MLNHRWPVFLILALIISAPMFGQTAARLETLLERQELSWADAAAFIDEAADAEHLEPWLPKGAFPDDTAKLNGVALLLMRSFDLKGGLIYRISKSPHHAYREMVYRKVIRGNADPDRPVSGPELLMMVNRVLAMTENNGGAQ